MVDWLGEDGLPFWPAPERNKGPILAELLRALDGRSGVFLEIGSATGQHALHFAPALPAFRYQPSDFEEEHLEVLRARFATGQLPNVLPPMCIDVREADWGLDAANVIYAANVIHFAPPEVTHGLFAGAARLLPADGLLVTYGPYQIDGRHTSESNERFDASLKEKNPTFGVRDLGWIEDVARPLGLVLSERVAMPANNFFLVWRRAN